MNIRKYTVAFFVLAVAAAGSFVATHAWQSPSSTSAGDSGCTSKPCSMECCRALADWLGMSPEQAKKIQTIDATFAEESTKLERALFDERQKLAALFDREDATAEAIQQQVEKVIAADNALERRVAAHLVALRPHLTAEQRAKLYKRCAQGVREAGGCRWRCATASGPAGCAGPSQEKPCEHGSGGSSEAGTKP
jgi:Spy/CpxP family protein refolding chaperone